MKNFCKTALVAMSFVALNAYAQSGVRRVVNSVVGTAASQTAQQGRDVQITGAGITRTVAMNGGNLTITGADCRITVTGSVNRIEINGAGVQVVADRVNSISIVGADTHVTYHTSGNRSGRAAVNIVGAGSGVSKR